MKILPLWEEVNSGKPRNASRTPLMFGVRGGHEGVAKKPLEREEVSPGRPIMEPKRPSRMVLLTEMRGW